ncbi:Major facilitator superfamily [Trinorchestia longiramus]|nr:Major facilitator superfamily [Trinorchestia longiramus]
MKETDVLKPSSKAPDGGWSWVVVACAFYNSLILLAASVSFGVIFSGKLTMMEVSSTTVAWIYNVFSFNFFMSSIFCGALTDVFSWRSVGFFSATISALGYACMIFATGPGFVFLLFSIVVGCSAGLSSFIGILVIPHYFDHHRGRAGAIIMTGVSTGQVIIPLLMRVLLDEYGFAGACLIFSGLVLNCAVVNLLLYPVPRRPLLKGDKLYEAARKAQNNQISLKTKIDASKRIEKSNKKQLESVKTSSEKLKEVFKITWLHTCQLQHMTLLIVNLSFSLFVVGYGNFTALLPFAMAAKGHPDAKTAYSLSIGAAANTAVRIFISWTSDKDWFSRKICYILSSIVSGLSTLATVFVLHDAQSIMICQIFWGMGIAGCICVFHNLMLDTCGWKLYDSGVAISGLLIAVCNIVLGPLIGVARDYTSYEVAIGMTAALQLASALLWIFMPLARRYDMKKFPAEQLSDEGTDPNCKDTIAGQINKGFIPDSGRIISRRFSVL